MKNNSLFTNIIGVLIAAGIIGIYTQINDLKDDITLIRMELVQYHTIVGVVQVEVEKIEAEVEKIEEELKNDRYNR